MCVYEPHQLKVKFKCSTTTRKNFSQNRKRGMMDQTFEADNRRTVGRRTVQQAWEPLGTEDLFGFRPRRRWLLRVKKKPKTKQREFQAAVASASVWVPFTWRSEEADAEVELREPSTVWGQYFGNSRIYPQETKTGTKFKVSSVSACKTKSNTFLVEMSTSDEDQQSE